MLHRSFSDFEEYAGAIQNIDWHCLLTDVNQSYWSYNHFKVGSIQIQGGHEGSPMIFEGATHRDHWALYLQRTGDFGSVNGIRLDPGSVFLIPAGRQVCFANTGGIDWQSVHIPTKELFPINGAPGGSHKSARMVKPGYGLVNRLRAAIDRFAQATEIEPSVLTEPASIANFTETLMDTARQILGFATPPVEQDRLSASRHQLISVAVQLIEECPEKSLSVKLLAQNMGVSERTLRSAFVKYLGTPPLKYLGLRRLHRARKLLQSAAPEQLTVSSVAASLGFWDFGRFAGNYRRLFGELPSKTLQRPRPRCGGSSEAAEVVQNYQ